MSGIQLLESASLKIIEILDKFPTFRDLVNKLSSDIKLLNCLLLVVCLLCIIQSCLLTIGSAIALPK